VAPVETADTPAADAASSDATGDAPYGPDSAKANEDGSGPDGFEIKGNADSMKFHAPGSPWYDSTKAEVWFRSAEAAEAAGFVNAQTSDDTTKD
jgi:small subunit ribosomal protein S2